MDSGSGMEEQGERTPFNPRGIRSQRDVARILGITQVRVGQIERRALCKLVRGLQGDSVLQEAFREICR